MRKYRRGKTKQRGKRSCVFVVKTVKETTHDEQGAKPKASKPPIIRRANGRQAPVFSAR